MVHVVADANQEDIKEIGGETVFEQVGGEGAGSYC
jgi:hypothetical protein